MADFHVRLRILKRCARPLQKQINKTNGLNKQASVPLSVSLSQKKATVAVVPKKKRKHLSKKQNKPVLQRVMDSEIKPIYKAHVTPKIM